MKKILFSLSIFALLISCAKENFSADELCDRNGIYMKAQPFRFAGNTRTDFSVDENGLKFSWNDNDKVAVFGAKGKDQQLLLNIVPQSNPSSKAQFTITSDFSLVAGGTYVAYYPMINDVTLDASKVSFDYSGQEQDGNSTSSTAHLGAKDYMITNQVTLNKDNQAEFEFHHKCCPLLITIENVEAGEYNKVTLKVTGDDCTPFAIQGIFNLFEGDNGTINPTEYASQVSVSFKDPVVLTTKGSIYAWIMVSPTDISDKTAKVVLTTDKNEEKTYDVGKDQITGSFEAGNAYKINVTCKKQSSGELPGYFTINSQGGRVQFSQGNLQYQASSKTWRFAEHQYDHVGDGGTTAGNVAESDNRKISSTYSGWIDLFGWATSGHPDYRKITEKPYPYNYDGSSANYKINGGNDIALTIEHYTDWGVNNIQFFDGEKYVEGKPASGWRTLKGAEWNYIIGATGGTHREGECRFMLCKCSESIYGVLIFPDDWTIEDWPDNSGNKPPKNDYNVNTAKSLPSLSISLELLGKLQKKGVVFLPQTGYRSAQLYKFNNTATGSKLLYYWAADGSTGAYTYCLRYEASTYADLSDFQSTTSGKQYGYAVRLVTDVPSAN